MKTLFLLAFVVSASAQTYTVQIMRRNPLTSEYEKTQPGVVTTKEKANAGCIGGANSANCRGQGESTTVVQPARTSTYTVQGTGLRLLLPDGRMVVVGCAAKTDFAGGFRDCRVPPMDELTAEFKGKGAKLKWPVSLDGKKTESETYEIIKIDPAGTELTPCVDPCRETRYATAKKTTP